MTTLTQHHAASLLDKLANDDSFRDQRIADPVAAMALVGVKVDPSTVPTNRRLPSKAEVSANADALQSKLQGNSGMGIFVLV